MNDIVGLSRPYPYLRIGHLGMAHQRDRPRILTDVGVHIDLDHADLEAEFKLGLDLVIVEPTILADPIDPKAPVEYLDALIACEGAGIPTVLQAERAHELTSRVAGVVSHIATTDASVHRLAVAQVGSERTLLAGTLVDTNQTFHAGAEEVQALAPESVTRRRQTIDERSPKAQADAFAEWLGFTVEPPPTVTAIMVSRKAENLDIALANLNRQKYPNIDVLLTIDPMYEREARETVASWDFPVRIAVSQPGGTLADRLNLGIHRAHGELVTVFEENALYGSHHITDLVQAALYSGADLVGKASWHVYDEAKDQMVVRAPGTQRSFGELPALGTMMMSRYIARRFGFTRRSSGINWPLMDRLVGSGSDVYSIHAYDTVLPKKGQSLTQLADRLAGSGAFPF